MQPLLVFAEVGLLVSVAVWLFTPRPRLGRILRMMVIGVIGAVIGGIVSWGRWPAIGTEDVHAGNLILAILGAIFAIVFAVGLAYKILGAMVVSTIWAGVAYKRNFPRHKYAPMDNDRTRRAR